MNQTRHHREPGALERWLMRPAPPQRLGLLRIAVGIYAMAFLVSRWTSFTASARLPERQFQPVGALAWMHSSVPASTFVALMIATLAAGLAFVAGWRFRLTGPGFAIGFLAVSTYRLSWGHVIHTEHLVALHLLVLGLTRAADAVSVDARRRDARPDPDERYGWPVAVMSVIVVSSYVLAGWSKLRNGGTGWLTGDLLRNQVAYDNLRKELLGSTHSPIGGWLVQYRWLFAPMAIATTAVELGAPIALLGRRWRTRWVAGAWLFHVGITTLMAITFPYQLTGVAYLCFFPVERVLTRWRRRAPARANRVSGRVAATR